ncbi:glutamate receptor 4 [Chrysoperla carnea]|uniref:glutamate receptor 4 n=1 Tax=Chrysoperla carnea TaxID=189513 RepID=UPI001D077911|nr:glutamate receptor 4 [Chrysoperla carnea]
MENETTTPLTFSSTVSSTFTLFLSAICANDSNCDFSSIPMPEEYYFSGLNNTVERYEELERSLKGQTIKVVTFQNSPLNNYEVDENGNYRGGGIAFTFLDLLSKKFEFNYTIMIPTDKVLGNEKKGVFGALASGEADVAAAFLPILPWIRGDVIDYSSQLDVGEWMVLLKRPSESATGSGLLAPFDYKVWILIFISLVMVGPVIYCIIVMRNKLCPGDEKNKIFSLPSCIWFVYGALLKQGSTLSPASDSSRMLFATWWIFITILTAFYTANLTAFLTLSKFTLPIEKPEDIALKKYPWVAQEGHAIEALVNEGSLLSFLQKSNKGKFVSENDAMIIKNFVDKGFMFLRDKPAVEHIMYDDYLNKTREDIDEDKRCTYVLTTWPIVKLPRAFGFRKNFEWTPLFDAVLKKLVESGIVKYKLRDNLPNTVICPQDLGEKGKKLHNSDLLKTYEVVGVGFAISIVVFVVEFLFRRCMSLKSTFKLNSSSLMGNRDSVLKSKETTNKFFVPPPPSYHTLFQPYSNSSMYPPDGKKKIINGRDYWVIKATNGDTRLIPVRTPSALLFQYTQ